MYFWSHSIKGRSSPIPLKRVIGMWVWVLKKGGEIILSVRSIISFALFSGSFSETYKISPFFIPKNPFSIKLSLSRMMVAFLRRMSKFSNYELKRRRPELNRGERFCKPLPEPLGHAALLNYNKGEIFKFSILCRKKDLNPFKHFLRFFQLFYFLHLLACWFPLSFLVFLQ